MNFFNKIARLFKKSNRTKEPKAAPAMKSASAPRRPKTDFEKQCVVGNFQNYGLPYHFALCLNNLLMIPNAWESFEHVKQPLWGLADPLPFNFETYDEFVQGNNQSNKSPKSFVEFIRDTIRLIVQPSSKTTCQTNKWLLTRLTIILNTAALSLPLPETFRKEAFSLLSKMVFTSRNPVEWSMMMPNGRSFDEGLKQLVSFLASEFYQPPPPRTDVADASSIRPLTSEERGRLMSHLRLALVFSKIRVTDDMETHIKNVYKGIDDLHETRYKMTSEIIACCDYFLSMERSAADVASSSKWFRECATQTEVKKMKDMGLHEYQRSLGDTAILSVNVAGYLKTLVKDYKSGVVPAFSKHLLVEIWKQVGYDNNADSRLIASMEHLLCLDDTRTKLLSSISAVAMRILKQCTTDVIVPSKLARVIKVDKLDVVSPEEIKAMMMAGGNPQAIQRQIHVSLQEWDTVWATVLANPEHFIATKAQSEEMRLAVDAMAKSKLIWVANFS